MPADAAQVLVPFGFTSLESEVYAFLLAHPPTTGYRIAKALGKAAANVYKAIETLQQKGAILVEEGENRTCRAAPANELLARLTRDFEWRRAEAELRLSHLDCEAADDRIYGLRSRAQVVERARHMIGGAEKVVLLACADDLVAELFDGFRAAATRRVGLFVATPGEVAIKGVTGARMEAALREMRLVVDGAQALLAWFAPKGEEVRQAFWSESPYFAVCLHRGLACEMAGLGMKPPAGEATPGFKSLA